MSRFAANLSMLFTDVDFLARFAQARACGFSAVEYISPYEFPPEVIQAELAQHGLSQVLFNLPVGNWAGGERGIACLPDRVDEFRQGVSQAIRYAKALNCPQVNCLAGKVPAGSDPQVIEKTLVANLRFAANALAKENIRLLIEPINNLDMPGFYLNTSRQALALIEQVGSQNLWLQYDIYHMQRMEGELIQTLRNHLSQIAHIQVADNPGRHEPGTGEINFDNIFSALDQMGYSGWIGCEYNPQGDTAAGLSWLNHRQR
ncbi:hydroxypyruvate isomerase [Ewingella sp. AOP9-I1-14]